jgi:hypothetical protein
MASFHSAAIHEEGATFGFGCWVCVANGQGSFNSHVANPRKPETPSLTFSQDVGTLAGGSSHTRLSGLFRKYASHL